MNQSAYRLTVFVVCVPFAIPLTTHQEKARQYLTMRLERSVVRD